MKYHKGFLALAAIAVMAIVACGDNYIGGDTITNNNYGPTPTTSPSPAVGSCPVAGVIDSIRVGPFGYRCTAGTIPPANGSGTLPVGCAADVTATPKDAAGNDVPAAVHGQGIVWSTVIGSSLIDVTDGSQPFNKNVSARQGITSGEFQLAASLCGKTGAWNGRVIP